MKTKKLSTVLAVAAALAMSACSTTVKDEDFGSDGFGYAGDENAEVSYGEVEVFSEEEAGNTVYFDYDSYFLSPEALKVLKQQIAEIANDNPKSIIIEGHCDERGTREYNLALGERRANAVKTYLVSKGVNPARINTVSYGKEKPAVLGEDENAFSLNRRSVIVKE